MAGAGHGEAGEPDGIGLPDVDLASARAIIHEVVCEQEPSLHSVGLVSSSTPSGTNEGHGDGGKELMWPEWDSWDRQAMFSTFGTAQRTGYIPHISSTATMSRGESPSLTQRARRSAEVETHKMSPGHRPSYVVRRSKQDNESFSQSDIGEDSANFPALAPCFKMYVSVQMGPMPETNTRGGAEPLPTICEY